MRTVVDTETAKEFMREILERVDLARLTEVCVALEAKSAWFRSVLARERLASLSEADYASLLARIFSARRNRTVFAERFTLSDMRGWIADLFDGGEELVPRFDRFVRRLDGLAENIASDFASELLHFTEPDRYWLWTRWMWDSRARTGALPLVTSVGFDLGGQTPGRTPGEAYIEVGRGLAFVHETGEAAGFHAISRNVFGTDVFLCCVHAVYTYTVLRMRMTKEFNRVMPGLFELCSRLLGVHPSGTRDVARVEA